MKVETTARPTYTPLPTDDFLPFTITDEKEQDSFFDKAKQVLNVEFSITAPGLDNRKVWRNFGPFWPRPTSTKVTQLYELVQAVDPANAKIAEGYVYNTANLKGKTGRLLMTDYLSKTQKEPDFLSDGKTPNPKAGQPLTMQKIKTIVGPKDQALANNEKAIASVAPVAQATQASTTQDAGVASEPKQIRF